MLRCMSPWRKMIEHEIQAWPAVLEPAQTTGADSDAMLVRNIYIDGRRTSIRIERIFWQALLVIAAQEEASVNEIATEIAAGNAGGLNFTSALRCFVLDYWFRRSAPGWRRSQVDEDGRA